jgi:hypothetical protein
VDGPYCFSWAATPMVEELADSDREVEGFEEESYASGRGLCPCVAFTWRLGTVPLCGRIGGSLWGLGSREPLRAHGLKSREFHAAFDGPKCDPSMVQTTTKVRPRAGA